MRMNDNDVSLSDLESEMKTDLELDPQNAVAQLKTRQIDNFFRCFFFRVDRKQKFICIFACFMVDGICELRKSPFNRNFPC
jgi:hypothetical protein